jgi:hypothetical protein
VLSDNGQARAGRRFLSTVGFFCSSFLGVIMYSMAGVQLVAGTPKRLIFGPFGPGDGVSEFTISFDSPSGGADRSGSVSVAAFGGIPLDTTAAFQDGRILTGPGETQVSGSNVVYIPVAGPHRICLDWLASSDFSYLGFQVNDAAAGCNVTVSIKRIRPSQA